MWAPFEEEVEIIRSIEQLAAGQQWQAMPTLGGVDPRRTFHPLLVVPNQVEMRLEMCGMEGPSAAGTWADTGYYGLWSPNFNLPDYVNVPANTNIGTMGVPIIMAGLKLPPSTQIFGYTQDYAGAGDYFVRLRVRRTIRQDFLEQRIPPLPFAERLVNLIRGRE